MTESMLSGPLNERVQDLTSRVPRVGIEAYNRRFRSLRGAREPRASRRFERAIA